MSTNQKHLVRFLSVSTVAFFSIAAYLVTVDTPRSEKILFTGNEQHQISTEQALRYVANYLSIEGEQLTGAYMGRNIFEKILAQQEAVGIRIYNARLDNGSPTFVIVGVDKKGNDLIGGVIGEDVLLCPPYCPEGTLTLSPNAQPLAVK